MSASKRSNTTEIDNSSLPTELWCVILEHVSEDSYLEFGRVSLRMANLTMKRRAIIVEERKLDAEFNKTREKYRYATYTRREIDSYWRFIATLDWKHQSQEAVHTIMAQKTVEELSKMYCLQKYLTNQVVARGEEYLKEHPNVYLPIYDDTGMDFTNDISTDEYNYMQFMENPGDFEHVRGKECFSYLWHDIMYKPYCYNPPPDILDYIRTNLPNSVLTRDVEDHLKKLGVN